MRASALCLSRRRGPGGPRPKTYPKPKNPKPYPRSFYATGNVLGHPLVTRAPPLTFPDCGQRVTFQAGCCLTIPCHMGPEMKLAVAMLGAALPPPTPGLDGGWPSRGVP